MNLSEHFTLEELTLSQVATRLGIDNTPSADVVDNLRWLCTQVLEPLRSACGRALFVSSGYRCELLNTAVRGSARSDHLRGLAADVTCPPKSVTELARLVHAFGPFVPLHQCIIEFGRWVHVSAVREIEVDPDVAPQFLVASLAADGTTEYRQWT